MMYILVGMGVAEMDFVYISWNGCGIDDVYISWNGCGRDGLLFPCFFFNKNIFLFFFQFNICLLWKLLRDVWNMQINHNQFNDPLNHVYT